MSIGKKMKGNESINDPYMVKIDRNMKWYLLAALSAWVVIPGIAMIYFDGELNSGTWGDTFGSVNALFTSIAFAFIVYTALMQRRELELQRKELELTRHELKRSAEAHNELVEINRMSYKLQLDLNNDTIKPSIGIVESLWRDDPQESGVDQFAIRMRVNNKKLKLTKIDLSENKLEIMFDRLPPTGKYFDELAEYEITLRTKFSEKVDIVDIALTVYYSDLMGNSYYQNITVQDNIALIGQPKDHSAFFVV